MQRALPLVSRRRMLIGAAALAMLSAGTAVACSPTPPVADVDDLLGQLDRARSDGQMAAAAAAAATPEVSAALTVTASERLAHAQALTDEITRMTGEAPTTTPPTATSAPATTGTSGAPPKPPSVADVVAALGQSASGASLLAAQQSGYRAGLLGSIAAACTASATVSLSNGRPTS